MNSLIDHRDVAAIHNTLRRISSPKGFVGAIFIVGNSRGVEAFRRPISRSTVIRRLGLKPRGYFLTTLHRAENVDSPERLQKHIGALTKLATEFKRPVIVSVYPRTADRIARAGIGVEPKKLRLERPFGLFDFIQLEKNALGDVTDSGTVQEEACIFGLPNVTIRDVTERPETTECSSNTWLVPVKMPWSGE